MIIFAITIFLSAFLLFQVQPMQARYILPWFGGTPAVWTTAVLFFQVMLLAGYLYAHLIATRLSLRRQAGVHAGLLLISLAFLPVVPAEAWKPLGDEAPLARIVLLLFATVAVPFLTLSSTGPLMQSWFARACPGRPAYRLFAHSNTGSFLGLLSYPFLIEPAIGLTGQTRLWSAGYAVFVLASMAAALTVFRTASPGAAADMPAGEVRKTTRGDRVLWLVLSATGVVVLLAATNQLCRDVMVIPLLWVLPLTLYLVSFVVCFGQPLLYSRPVWAGVLVVSVAAVLYLLHADELEYAAGLYAQIAAYSAVVFSCCMVCHGELYRLRPATRHLTGFYLRVALGGALGGVFVNLAAPLVFLGYWEFHAGLVAVIVLLAVCVERDRRLRLSEAWRWRLGGGWLVVLAGTVYGLGAHIGDQQEQAIVTERGFFGILRVYEFETDAGDAIRSFYHGRIGHGDQFLAEADRMRPITYYGPDSGIAVALAAARGHLQRPMRIGVVGLGTATLAAYARAADRVRFYELNPAVTGIAETYFTFLDDSDGAVEIVHGDARVSMERELRDGRENRYDVLAVDAFSGDAIPVHLLTREALAVYRGHLAPDGIIALHISNHYFDLRPVVQALAEDAGLQAAWVEDVGAGRGEDNNDWVLLTGSDDVHDRIWPEAEFWPQGAAKDPPWSDDFADVLGAVWRD